MRRGVAHSSRSQFGNWYGTTSGGELRNTRSNTTNCWQVHPQVGHTQPLVVIVPGLVAIIGTSS